MLVTLHMQIQVPLVEDLTFDTVVELTFRPFTFQNNLLIIKNFVSVKSYLRTPLGRGPFDKRNHGSDTYQC